ncbi:hypothetical protein WCE14_09275 [Acinetobacter schindleri]|uniref:HTH cro/C1-type domain-containing protein n=1 Tax=Acinetobacter schindleri NIPH 900 TaxID=1217675 RepID=N8Y5U2_9GAMM|nr:hypothetical protein [Acinetobacter schindleri]ENV14690.1 hypothetical protein F965_00036 [Acinetobacter schindleri NIPH 900]
MSEISPSIRQRQRFIDVAPKEGIEAVKRLNEVFKIYFKNQTEAGRILRVNQTTVNRYLSGVLAMPLDVAKRVEEHTQGVIKAETISFDYKKYLFDLKQPDPGVKKIT